MSMFWMILVLRFCLIFGHESCGEFGSKTSPESSTEPLEPVSEPGICKKKGVSWYELDYRAYMLKDLENKDGEELFQTYSINVVKSSKLKPNR